jgi:hypothetical protein
VLRRHVRVPADHVIVCGVALGYADEDDRLSGHRTIREPVSAFACFSDGVARQDSA